MCVLAKSYLASLPLGIIPGSLNVAFAKLDKTIRVRIPSYTGIATVYSTAKEGHLKAKKTVRQRQVKACKFSRRGHNQSSKHTKPSDSHENEEQRCGSNQQNCCTNYWYLLWCKFFTRPRAGHVLLIPFLGPNSMFFSVEHQANKSEHACNDIALSAVFRSNVVPCCKLHFNILFWIGLYEAKNLLYWTQIWTLKTFNCFFKNGRTNWR